jgi:preprotein translocase subunit SecG
MIILITSIHVLVCLFLIIVVLLQSGKAADLAGAFGGMGSQTVFGPRGSATVLSKATTISAVLFMLTSMTLSIYATRGGATPSILDKATKPLTSGQAQPTPAPAPKSGTVPITVTPSVDGKQGQPQTVPLPVQTVPAGKAPTLPGQQPPGGGK